MCAGSGSFLVVIAIWRADLDEVMTYNDIVRDFVR